MAAIAIKNIYYCKGSVVIQQFCTPNSSKVLVLVWLFTHLLEPLLHLLDLQFLFLNSNRWKLLVLEVTGNYAPLIFCCSSFTVPTEKSPQQSWGPETVGPTKERKVAPVLVARNYRTDKRGKVSPIVMGALNCRTYKSQESSSNKRVKSLYNSPGSFYALLAWNCIGPTKGGSTGQNL